MQLAGLRERIIDAFILGLVYTGSRLVSIGALKNPIANYHLDVFRKAGIPDQAKPGSSMIKIGKKQKMPYL